MAYDETFPFNEQFMGEFSAAKDPFAQYGGTTISGGATPKFSVTDLASLLDQKAGAPKPDYATINELLTGDTTKRMLSGTDALVNAPPSGQTRADAADAAKVAAAKSIAYSSDIQPRYLEEQAQDILNKDAAKAITPLENWYKYGSETAPPVPGSIEDLKQYTNLNTGMSARALQDLGIQYPGTGMTAPVFQPEAPAKGVGIGKAVPAGATGPVDKTGLTPTVGSEFGEVDNPARGGYTEQGWNVGAWGDTISGKDTKLIALPVTTLKAYGNPGDSDFAKTFNSKFDVQIVDPKTGKAAISALGDKGPGASTGAGIDLTYGTRAALGLPENFKGPVQYRIVPKGSALPSGTTSTGSAQPAPGTAAPTDYNTYIKPIDQRLLRNPEIYGLKNSDKDNMTWAQNLADQYATQMAQAGAPLNQNEYKERFKEFYDATVKKAQGEVAQALPAADMDKANSLQSMIPQLDALMEAKKKAGVFTPVALPAPNIPVVGDAAKAMADWINKVSPLYPKPDEQDYFQKRILLTAPIVKGLSGLVGSMSDQDIANAQKTMPTEQDTIEESQKKVDTLKQQALDQMKLLIQTRRAGHFDTRDLEANYLNLKKQVQPVVDQREVNANVAQHDASIAAKGRDQQPQKKSPDWWIPTGAAPAAPSRLPGR